MRVSVVIPTLNEAKALGHALKSVRSQKTSHDVELIIVDSYSDDGTLEIAKQFTDRIFFTPPGIIAEARQKGSMEAEGDIIVSAGADNVYDERWLEELVAPIAEKRSVGTAGKVLPMEAGSAERFLSEHVLSVCYGASLGIGIPLIAGESMAFSKEAFRKVGGYSTELATGEDIDLAKKLMRVGKVSYCPRAVAHVSMRRIRKWGYAKFLWFHGTNFVNTHLGGKPHTYYEPVR